MPFLSKFCFVKHSFWCPKSSKMPLRTRHVMTGTRMLSVLRALEERRERSNRNLYWGQNRCCSKRLFFVQRACAFSWEHCACQEEHAPQKAVQGRFVDKDICLLPNLKGICGSEAEMSSWKTLDRKQKLYDYETYTVRGKRGVAT
jgi:hypothetical protein